MGVVRGRLVLVAAVLLSLSVPAYAQQFDDTLQDTFDPEATLPEPGWEDSETFDEPLDVVDADPRALSDFRPYLDPYGEWYQVARFGLLWVPSRDVVGDDFAPYLSEGYWALDTLGNWVWVSNYAFGPVVFHYGRWVWVTGVGWAWVPGYRYAPAWVTWRVPVHYSGVYVGWAPLPPSYVWVDGVAVGVGFYVMTPWVFCPSYYVFSHHLYRHRVHEPERMRHAARETRPYPGEDGRVGPSPTRANVPRSRVPVSRVPAHPVPRARPNAVPSTVAPAPPLPSGSRTDRPRVQSQGPAAPHVDWPPATPSHDRPRPLQRSTSAAPSTRAPATEPAVRAAVVPNRVSPSNSGAQATPSNRQRPRAVRRSKTSSPRAPISSGRYVPARVQPGTTTIVPRAHAPSAPKRRTPQQVRR